jgi:hypothetical protein
MRETLFPDDAPRHPREVFELRTVGLFEADEARL